jgi:hypothetical protein
MVVAGRLEAEHRNAIRKFISQADALDGKDFGARKLWEIEIPGGAY